MCKLENKIIKVLIYRLTYIILNFIIFLFKLAYTTLQEKSELETYNSVSNPSGNGILDRLETKFSVFKTSNCENIPSLIRDGFDSVSNQRRNNSVSYQRQNFFVSNPSLT